MERIVTHGDGWLPVVGPGQFEATARTWDQIRQRAAARGRDAGKMELIVVGNVTFAGRQPWFSTTARMLEVAQEIHERVREARI
jgi:hypothetical protein